MVDVPWPVIYEASCPTLALGARRFDTRHRAVVMGLLDTSAGLDDVLSSAEGLVGAGAVALDLGSFEEVDRVIPVVRSLGDRFDVPLCVATAQPEVRAAALATGAAAWNDTSGRADPEDLEAVVAAGASLLLTPAPADGGADAGVESVVRALGDGVARAEAAGLASERVVIDARPMAALSALDRLAALRCPVAVTPAGADGLGRGGSIAVVALGIALGVRLIRTRDVRGARRTADVMAAVLAAREPVGP